MHYLERILYDSLLEWKRNPYRLALLLRGARQVGKTYLKQELGKTFYQFIEINFEMDKDISKIFHSSPYPVIIVEQLAILFGILY